MTSLFLKNSNYPFTGAKLTEDNCNVLNLNEVGYDGNIIDFTEGMTIVEGSSNTARKIVELAEEVIYEYAIIYVDHNGHIYALASNDAWANPITIYELDYNQIVIENDSND